MSKDKCKNGCDMLPVIDGYCLYCVRMGLNKSKAKVSKKETPKKKLK